MVEQAYKYRREDFPPLPVKLNHITLYINFLDDVVEVANLLDMTAVEELADLALDAKELDIRQVRLLEDPTVSDDPGQPMEYQYLEDVNRLVVRLPKRMRPGQRFGIRTVTLCIPSDHILEGIYKDSTPPGAPQQFMSQCQQWGFQRIAPILDDCRAKCTMTTTIEADASYGRMISNGNISADLNPDGNPVPKPDDPFRQIIRYENSIPMPPYLFLVCVGTWDTLTDFVTFDTGRTVRLEYLVPPGRIDDVRIPMAILKDAVLWVKKTQDYEYPADTYRTICMNKSNFGGMENMGNTTIVTDSALVDEHTLDQTLLYVHAVIVHEFEHNQCGSETTMETPFDVWLNEAYTVDVERQYMADMFDPAFIRLNQVDAIRSPLLGPLAIEDGGRAGRIVREGFNDPDELIDGVTYVKAAEVIGMLRLIIGADKFDAGKTLYFSRYKYSNADTEQFFACFEEVSGRDLSRFKQGWLYTRGYPKVAATTRYDAEAGRYLIDFSQDFGNAPAPFHLPIQLALVAKDGTVVPGSEQVFEFDQEKATLSIWVGDEEPAFASINRDYSFYGTFALHGVSPQSLALQARRDTNPFNRVEAMRQLTDIQRVGLMHDPGEEIDPDWLSLYRTILEDRDLPPGLQAFCLRIDEQPLDRDYIGWYREMVAARELLMAAVNRSFRDLLVSRFHDLDTYRPRQSPREGIEDRIPKNVLLELIAIDDTPESHRLILDHHRAATSATDRVASLIALNRSSASERRRILEDTYAAWHGHLSAYANYLRVVSAGTRDDVFDMIEAEKRRATFDIRNPTWSRALLLPMAVNNKMVWTEQGIGWVADTVIELSSINGYVASRLLNTFQLVRLLKDDLRALVTKALERIVREVPATVSPTVHGQAKAYLGAA
ncbi:MAG: M1 family metallopeptidase [Desulfomonilaceae bacterium]|nr:M1 family metallopeptidase [Desulfomonilaceae bacterium]